ncbi:MAG: POT family MFS transporter [Nitrospinota bacterium]|jgi:POT family proton-dependent oligopeptide transporter|nr:MFS transporter [Nitrospinota bacterium]MDP7351097.1 POT family MFS transporter [Nitrospinota bacterium]HJN01538.1 POT family MFS transporter [Nitrospinota bacterium]|tara:strand:+ start:2037 stop:3383 length:1347 start_codon:yes stop_codon:yes gene_type:complete
MSKPPTSKMPPGIPYIIGNELAERFSYYGMKTIMVIFMTKYLMDSSGNAAPMTESDAKYWYHIFNMTNYLFPILGAFVADILLGKFKTIISLSILYCLGHLALGLFDTRFGLCVGLTLIAMGSGGIKPCVSAHVGDQFRPDKKHLINKIFSVFYLSINIGAAISSLLTPVLLNRFGPHVAFGVPGVLMLIATIVFWMGKRKFVAIQPVGWNYYKNELFSIQGKKALLQLSIIYAFISIFWSLFDQTGSAWVLQAARMNRMVNLGFIEFELLPSQIQAINPLMIIILIPLFVFIVYPYINKFYNLTALRKITAGMFIASFSFVLCAIPENQISHGGQPTILWQFFAYLFLTIGEVLVSITALEFAYTQAPNSMKSFVMGFYLLSISLGNLVTAIVNGFIQNPNGSNKLEGAAYYWFFVALMVATAITFVFISKSYKEESYIQSGGKLVA